MTNYEFYITGIFPRDDRLISIWKMWEWGKATGKDLEDEIRREAKEVIDLQVRADLTYIHNPHINWHDLFRPFTKLENIREGPLTRFFENNTFYRKPIIVDKQSYKPGLLDEYMFTDLMPKGRDWIYTLPGLYTFYKLSEFRDRGTAIDTIQNVILGAMEDLRSNGFRVIILHEPSIAYEGEYVDTKTVKDLYKPLIESGFEYWLHLYFGDVNPVIGLLCDIAQYGFSVDLSYTPIEILDRIPVDRLSLGIIDAQNSLLEDVEDLVKTIRGFNARVKFKNIGVCPNTDLDYLPYNIARAKIMVLAHLARRLRG